MFLKLTTLPMSKPSTLVYILLLTLPCRVFTQNAIEWLLPVGSYESVQRWGDYFLVQQNGRWGVLDAHQNFLIKPKFENAYVLNEWAFSAQEKGLWGVFHRNNFRKWAVRPQYYPEEGSSVLTSNWGLPHSWLGYRNGYAFAITVSEKGVVLQPATIEPPAGMEVLEPQENAPAAPQMPSPQPWHSQWGSVDFMFEPYVADDETTWKIPRRDVFKVTDNEGKTGIVDSTGRILIPTRSAYFQVVQFNTLALLENRGQPGPEEYAFYRLSDGKRMSPKTYQHYITMSVSSKEPILVWNDLDPSAGKGYGLLSPAGEEQIPCVYESLAAYAPPGFMPAKKGGKWGIIDMKNELLLPFEYEEILVGSMEPAADVYVTKNGKMGVLRVKGRK